MHTIKYLALSLFFFPAFAFAQGTGFVPIISQTNNPDQFHALYTTYMEVKVGNGHSGNVEFGRLWGRIDPTGVTDSDIVYITITGYTNSSYNVSDGYSACTLARYLTGSWFSATSTFTGSDIPYWSGDCVIKPTSYYTVHFNVTKGDLQLVGVIDPNPTNPVTVTPTNPGGFSPYFGMFGTYIPQQGIQFYNLWPDTTRVHATSTDFDLVFSWRNKPTTVDGYTITLSDFSLGTSRTLIGSLNTSTGTTTRPIATIEGHSYKWCVTPSYGGVATSSTGINCGFFASLVDFNDALIQHIGEQPLNAELQDEEGNLVFGSHSTSTIGSFLNPLNLISGSFGFVCGKFPFSYICDFGKVIKELDQTAGTTTISYSLPFGLSYVAQGSTHTSLEILNPDTIQSGGLIPAIRVFIVYALWLMFGFGMFRMLVHAF